MDQDHTGTANPLAPESVSATNENKSETPNQTTVEPVTPTPPIVDPITPPSTPTPLTDPKKPKGLITTVIILAILALAGIAFGVYGMFFQPKPTCETTCTDTTSNKDSTTQPQTKPEEKEAYQLSDYVSFSEVTVPVTFPEEVQKGHTEDIIKKIELKNLPADTMSRFNEAQEKLIAKTDGAVIFRSNNADAAINENILSAFTVFSYQGAYEKMGDAETINYDLKSNSELTNTELLKDYNLTSKAMYETILNQLVQNVTTSSFLLSLNGDISAPTISVVDFTNNIAEYSTTLSGNLNLVKLYVDKNNSVHTLYQQHQILEALGMSCHMGKGLLPGVQDAELK